MACFNLTDCTGMQGKTVIMVFLDCEGMNSWERLEVEDSMLALLSAALSNLTLLKYGSCSEQSAFNLADLELIACGADQA